MGKKGLTIGLLILAVLGLLYYANISYIKSENEKTQEKLKSTVDSLARDRESLEKKIADIQNQSKGQPKGSLVLTDAQIQSNDIYNSGDVKGAIYGAFNVAARVRNVSNTEVTNVKVTALFARNSTGQTSIGVDPKAQTIDKLAPGEEKEVLISGFRVDHPEISQEVIVNVFHPFIADINDTSNVKKINVRAAFPPNSKD